MKRRLLIWLGVSLSLIFIVCSVLIYFWPEKTDDTETTAYPVYISDLFVSGNELFALRAKTATNLPREYDLYRISEDGREYYVQPYPGKAAHRNKDTGNLYFVSGTELCEFAPITGQCQSYSLEHAYEKICAAEEENVFLQQELYGPVSVYSLLSGAEYAIGASGVVLGAYDGHLLTWNIYSNCLTCYSYKKDQTLWTIDLSEKFSGIPILCANNGDLYLANRNGGYVYRIPRFTEQSILEKLEIYTQALGVVDAHDYILYAAKQPQSIIFYVLFPDGSREKLTEWTDVNYYQDSSLVMTLHNKRLYCTVKTEECFFSCDLPG